MTVYIIATLYEDVMGNSGGAAQQNANTMDILDDEEGGVSDFDIREPADLCFSGEESERADVNLDNIDGFGEDVFRLNAADDVNLNSDVTPENAMQIAGSIARAVASEHDEDVIAYCFALEVVLDLGDAVFNTPATETATDAGLPTEEHKEGAPQVADIQLGPSMTLRSLTERRVGAALCSPFNMRSIRISTTWTKEERDCYLFLLATPRIWM
ncbi:uncharacterized protein LOC125194750 [Salvia hispanica]|uniref:uncharacterized protein LOC125194750 n=1 Tax=Salvia hispanica TaxID=49212 RepID=UPI0020094CBB|nr:uncharacterized protein LOC125194750 [Salvia hispanica]